jgi:hypothetical protein
MPTIGGSARLRQPESEQEGEAQPSAGGTGNRALVLVSPIAAVEPSHPAGERPMPAFLAQLVATGQRAPQTRAGRRAEPAQAAETYRASLIIPPAKGGVLLRSV